MTKSSSERWVALTLGLACLLPAGGAQAEPELRTGTIVLGVPRADFVVLGADRLWTNALAKPGDPLWKRQGPQGKIVIHRSLPLAIAVAGLSTLGEEQDAVSYVRELIAPLDASSLHFDPLVERLGRPLHDKVRALRSAARRVLAARPADTEATLRLKVARQTLVIAFVAAGRATLGWIQIDDEWRARREAAPHGAVAWPDSLEGFYTRGPYAGAARLFGYAISDRAGLVEHVRRVVEAGIREDARLNRDRYRHVGGPVDVVLIDARGARCVPACPPP
jgi:hypothetical protein